MIKKVTNFVLNKTQNNLNLLKRTNVGGSAIRNTRLKKFKKKSKGLIVAAQIVAIWYLMILTSSYLTTNTGAYFNDVENISGTISVAQDFCKDAKKGSDFWHKYCKEDAGLGNGPDKPDVDTGEHTDPDNPGHNKDDCDDHTNAPCSDPNKEIKNQPENENDQSEIVNTPLQDVKDLIGSRNGTSPNISLSWKNPSSISHVRIYIDGQLTPIQDNVKNENIQLTSDVEVTYRFTTVDSSGKESAGVTVTVK